MTTARQSSEEKDRGFLARPDVTIIGGMLIVLTLLCLAHPPFIIRGREGGDRSEAINNLKIIGLGLQEFDTEYGRFPDTTTADRVKEVSHTTLTLGHASSNQLFRQLLVTGAVSSERDFFCQSRREGIKVDKDFSDDAHALAPGECGFAYVSGLSPDSDPWAPVAMAPLIPGTTCFDPKPFGKKAIILFASGSAMSVLIEADGHVRTNGMDLFDSRQPFWQGQPHELHWQE